MQGGGGEHWDGVWFILFTLSFPVWYDVPLLLSPVSYCVFAPFGVRGFKGHDPFPSCRTDFAAYCLDAPYSLD